MRRKATIVLDNSYNDRLLPGGDGEIMTDFVDGVNDRATEVPRFGITREELVQLLKYWYREDLEMRFSISIYGEIVRWQGASFVEDRIGRIEGLIGEKDDLDKAFQEVRQEFKASKDPRIWDIYEKGEWEQRKANLEEMRELDATNSLSRLKELEAAYCGSFIALVVRQETTVHHKIYHRAILLSPTNSELNARIQLTNEIEVETDKSEFKARLTEEHSWSMGFLRIIPSDHELRFEFPDSTPGTIGWWYLQTVADKIRDIWKVRK